MAAIYLDIEFGRFGIIGIGRISNTATDVMREARCNKINRNINP